MDIIYKEIEELFSKREYEKAMKKATHLLNRSKNISAIAFANEYIGKIYHEMQNFSKVKPYLTRAITLYMKQKKIDKMLNLKNILAISLAKSTEFEEAKKLFEELATFYKAENNILEVAKALGNIATIYSMFNDFKLAIKTYKNCLDFIKEGDDKDALAMVHYNLGENYMYIKSYETAINFLKKAIDIGKENNNISIQIRANDCLAGVFFLQNNFETALEYEDIALNLLKKVPEKRLLNNVLMNKSRILFNMNELDESLKIIETIFSEAKKINDHKSLQKYYELKIEIYKKAKNYKKAYYAKEKCSKIEQKHFDIERLKIIEEGQEKANRLMIELNNEKKEKELIILKNKKEILDKELTFKALQIVQKNELIASIMSLMEKLKTKNPGNLKIINEIIELVSVDSASESVWNEFEKWFTEVNRNFFSKLEKITPNLTLRYRQLAAFIKLGLRSKEIALIMGISTSSVEKYRQRFRKFLNLTKDEKLFDFINKL